MFEYRILKEVDIGSWNNQLLNCNYSTFYQTEEYQKSDLTRFPLFIYVHDKEGSILGQLVVTVLKIQSAYSTSFLKKYIESISKIGNRVYWTNGPIIHSSDKKTRIKVLETLFKAMNEIAENYNVMIIDGYSTPQDTLVDDDYLDAFRKNGYKIENFVTFVFELGKNLDDIWMNVKKYTRINVKRAVKRNIIIREITDKSGLTEFYKLANRWGKTKGLKSTNVYPSLSNDLKKIEDGVDKFFSAYQNDKIISAIRISHFNGIVSPTQVLSSYEDEASLGGPALTWHAIKWSKENGMKIYDFTGGKSSPNNENELKNYEKQWSSLLTYKRKWGGKEIPYYHFIKIKRKMAYKLFRVLSKPDWFYRSYKKARFVRRNKSDN